LEIFPENFWGWVESLKKLRVFESPGWPWEVKKVISDEIFLFERHSGLIFEEWLN